MIKSLKTQIKEKYDFVEEDPISVGGFGQIYIIKDKKVNTQYVLKQILKQDPKNSKKSLTNKISFENEINFLKFVKGKNILKLVDYYEDENDKYYYIILEKMDGDLEDMLEKYKNGMPSKLIRKIFSQINSGLESMLDCAKCHRDLKPSNILYSYVNNEKKDFVIKLGDFGLATDLKYTQYATDAGTKLFKAPEVEEGKYSYKCDLYSIGIILYYLKTGEYIFDGKREIDILNNKDKNIIKKDTDDELLNNLIRKLVVNDPHKRMEWDDYFKDPFFKFDDDDIEQNKECKINYIFNKIKY